MKPEQSALQSTRSSEPQNTTAWSPSQHALLELAELAEFGSTHPIAESIRAAWEGEADPNRVTDIEEIAGQGIRARVDGRQVLAGNGKLLESHGIAYTPCKEPGTVVYLAQDNTFAGAIVISDVMKDGAAEAIRAMKRAGVRKTVMLTGDREEAARAVAEQIGIDEVHAQLLPGDKVEQIERMLAAEQGSERTAFVGDGINDAPVLMRSDVGIAMGSLGSDAAIEAADIVLMDDSLEKIARTVAIARKTLGIIHGNIIFAIAVKIAILVLSVFGIANMWMAIFGDVGVLVLCILNAMRLLRRD